MYTNKIHIPEVTAKPSMDSSWRKMSDREAIVEF